MHIYKKTFIIYKQKKCIKKLMLNLLYLSFIKDKSSNIFATAINDNHRPKKFKSIDVTVNNNFCPKN